MDFVRFCVFSIVFKNLFFSCDELGNEAREK